MNESGVDDLVVIATFREPNQAHLARLRLEAGGIRGALDGEHHVAMDWFMSNAIGGVKLLVNKEDAEAANKILQEVVPDNFREDADIEENQGVAADRCPICNSTNTYREQVNRRLVFLSLLFLGIPIPFLSRKMACETCGHRWSNS